MLVGRFVVVALAELVGKLVLQLQHRERACVGDGARALDPRRPVRENAHHLVRAFEVSFGVLRKAAAGLVERDPLTDAMEHVEDRFGFTRGVANSIRGAYGNPESPGGLDSPPLTSDIGAIEVTVNGETDALPESFDPLGKLQGGGGRYRGYESP